VSQKIETAVDPIEILKKEPMKNATDEEVIKMAEELPIDRGVRQGDPLITEDMDMMQESENTLSE